ncbi:MAG: hypothetical protein HRU76_14480 [Phycisphaeraceae bacterium]|nr:MAG: hypothetical protein HRU76_14480 [Phycisphaeraceae bacterium]
MRYGLVAAVFVSVLATGGPASARADQVVLVADRDNTLYERPAGDVSNGAGQRFFAGRTGQQVDGVRRGLLRFDVAGAVPPGSVITGVTLRLNMSRTRAGNRTVSIHRLLSDWGEGPSDAFGEEGDGTTAEPGDATWLHRFHDTVFWTQPGGDYVAAASASRVVGGLGAYVWGSTPAMVADVQAWLDNPGSNFGWIVIGDESTTTTAKRFDSREHPTQANRPRLTIDYLPAARVLPDAFTRLRGLPVSGGLADLHESDDLRLVTRPDVFRTSAVPPVQIEVGGQSPVENPSEIVVRVESHASVNNIQQRLLCYDFDAQQYVQVDARILPTADGVIDVRITSNPGRYIENGSRRMKLLLQCNAIAFTIAPVWQARQDQVIWVTIGP